MNATAEMQWRSPLAKPMPELLQPFFEYFFHPQAAPRRRTASLRNKHLVKTSGRLFSGQTVIQGTTQAVVTPVRAAHSQRER